jgi:tRNA 2-thiouridine synthesizing protein A
MEPKSKMTDSRTAEALILEMKRKQRRGCAGCRAGLCSHQVLMNIAMGFGDNPRCLHCLAVALERHVDELRESLIAYLQQKECHQTAWAWADRHEGVPASGWRACLNFEEGAPNSALKPAHHVRKSGPLKVAVAWDAGHMGCGDLVLELRLRLQSMRPGEIIKLCARDPGAPEDLPAWCRLTGHVLLRAQHPVYWIERRK